MDYTMMIAVYVSVLIVFLLIMLFGPTRRFRDGPLGFVYWCLTEGLFERAGVACRAICGETMTRKMGTMLMCVTQTAHPMLQIFYVGLLGGGIYFFYRAGYPRIPNEYIPHYHLYVIPFIISCSIGSFLVASFSNPGIITKKNVEKVCAAYTYDRLLYIPKMCSTCGFVKPARSKHCSLCKACVARNCHHCPWVNNCIGAKNHRFFLNFLLCNLVMTGYGTWITFFLMLRVYDQSALPHLLSVSMRGLRPITTTQCAAYLLQREPYLGSLFLFLTLVTIVILAFFLHQLYLVARGTTTNETFKWDDIKDNVLDGRLFVSNTMITDDATAEASARAKSDTKLKASRKQGKNKHSKPSETTSSNAEVTPTMIPVQKFSELKNAYNKGVMANFREILFPPDF